MALENFKPGDSLEEEEIKALATDKPNKEILAKLGVTSMDEFIQKRNEILSSASNTETYFQRLEKKVKRGQATEDTLNALNVARDISKLGIATGQINQSNRQLSKLKRPQLPVVPKYDNSLDYEINKAQQGTFDAARAVEPARQAIDRGYAADLANDRGAVGGQSGAYGALGQVAALRRNRAYGELAPMVDNIRNREKSRVDQLLARRSAERQTRFDNQNKLYDYTNQNYQNDTNAASNLGLVGRENLNSTFDNLPNSLAGFAGTTYGNNYGLHPDKRTMVPEIDNFMEIQQKNNPLYNPSILQQPSALPAKLQSPYYNKPRGYSYHPEQNYIY